MLENLHEEPTTFAEPREANTGEAQTPFLVHKLDTIKRVKGNAKRQCLHAEEGVPIEAIVDGQRGKLVPFVEFESHSDQRGEADMIHTRAVVKNLA